MVFKLNSNEHTQKVCLSSRLAENYLSANPKFMLRTPIKAPWNVVSMVCLESAILEAPSMFMHSLIDDESNQLVRFVDVSAESGFTKIYQDYWNESAGLFGGLRAVVQSNMKTMKQIFKSTIHSNFTCVDRLAEFLMDFIYKTKAFRCYLGDHVTITKTEIQ